MFRALLRWPSLFVVTAVLGIAAVVGWWKLPIHLTLPVFYSLCLLACSVAVCCLFLTLQRKRRRDERFPLYLYSASIILVVVSQLIAPGLALYTKIVVPPLATAVLFLLAHCALGAGLLFGSGRYPRSWVGIATVAGDALITVFVFALIIYERGLDVALSARGTGIVSWCYMIGILATLLCLVVSMSTMLPMYKRNAWRLLLAGAGLLLGGDAALAQVGIAQADAFPYPLLCWIIGIPFLGIAIVWEHAARPRDAADAREPDEYLSAVSVLVPAVLLAAEALIMAIIGREVLHAPQALLIYRLFALLTMLVLVRFLINIVCSRFAYGKLLERVKESERVSVTDPLTGLPNKRACMQRLEDEMARARRYQRPFSVVFGDIDFFKLINDVHGHHTGDVALIEVGKCLHDRIRTTDMVARLGGEEFVLILPETTVAGADILAERLRQAIENLRIPTPAGQPLHLTISLGIAGYPETSDDPERLLQDADEAMNRAKDTGRNRVTMAKAKVTVFAPE